MDLWLPASEFFLLEAEGVKEFLETLEGVGVTEAVLETFEACDALRLLLDL